MDYQKLMEYRNTHNPFAIRLGITLTELSLGHAEAIKHVEANDLNPVNRTHGGCLFALADATCGAAAASHGHQVVTLSASYNFLRGCGEGDTILSVAREVKAGKTVGVYDVELRSEQGELLGNASFTFYFLSEKIDL